MIVNPGELPTLEALDWLVLGAGLAALIILVVELRRPAAEGE